MLDCYLGGNFFTFPILENCSPDLFIWQLDRGLLLAGVNCKFVCVHVCKIEGEHVCVVYMLIICVCVYACTHIIMCGCRDICIHVYTCE